MATRFEPDYQRTMIEAVTYCLRLTETAFRPIPGLQLFQENSLLRVSEQLRHILSSVRTSALGRGEVICTNST